MVELNNKRRVFVLMPVEIELYDNEDEKNIIGSIVMPTEKQVKEAVNVQESFNFMKAYNHCKYYLEKKIL